MAEKSNWYDFLIPSEETREAITKGIEQLAETFVF